MKPETEALLRRCRTALLERSDEELVALLKSWFESMICEEYMEEVLDDLCLLLNWRVQSEGASVVYGTYTSWWEVEGYLDPGEGTVLCTDGAVLRQDLSTLPIKQFDLVTELAFQVLTADAEGRGRGSLPTGQVYLASLAVWLGDISRDFEAVPLPPRMDKERERKEQRRAQVRTLTAQACEQRYLVVDADTLIAVKDSFRHWCKAGSYPYICVELLDPELSRVFVDLKTLTTEFDEAEIAQLQERLVLLAAPYIARAQAQYNLGELDRLERQIIAVEDILAEDAEQVAVDLVTLLADFLASRPPRIIVQPPMHFTVVREATWTVAIKRLSASSYQPPLLPVIEVSPVLLKEWLALLTRPQLCAFLTFLGLPAASRDLKADLVERLQKRVETDQTAQAQLLEVFASELAVPPWELEAMLPCTPTERKRWTAEGRLNILEQRNFRKGGSQHDYPVFDRRVIMSLSQAEVASWRAEHQASVQTNRKAGAQVAAATRKARSKDEVFPGWLST